MSHLIAKKFGINFWELWIGEPFSRIVPWIRDPLSHECIRCPKSVRRICREISHTRNKAFFAVDNTLVVSKKSNSLYKLIQLFSLVSVKKY